MSNEEEHSNFNTSKEDWFLQHLVLIVNSSESAEIGITLNVGGFLISGILVGGKQYFKEFANEISLITEGANDAEEIKNHFEEYGEKYDSESSEQDMPIYIHLKNARFYTSQGGIPNDSVWWRGRISEVQGFIFGSLEES